MEKKNEIIQYHKITNFTMAEFVRLSKGNPERIVFLFEDELLTSKRYEKFEKKKIAELMEFFKTKTPMAHAFEYLEEAIMYYIANIVVTKGDIGPFIYKNAIAESVAAKEKIEKMIKKSIGIFKNEEEGCFEIDNEHKTLAFVTHIKNEIRQAIKNTLISKTFYDNRICKENYTLVTEFTDTEKDMMISNVIHNAINYIVFNSEQDITPNELDYEGLRSNTNTVLDRLAEEYNKVVKENEILSKKLIKKSQTKTAKTTKKVKVDNPELVKENKSLQNELKELKNIVAELEEIIALKEGAERIEEDVLRDVREDKILFVGGHDNELRKLNYIFKNSESFVKCSMDVQSNYLLEFDYIVFLTHYMSHSLYHKIKGLADISKVPYIHCEYNNPKIIAEYIAKHFPQKEKDTESKEK